MKVGAALITGNTVVAKPAQDTPLSTLHLARLFAEAGYPAGVANVVTGSGRELGEALVGHPLRQGRVHRRTAAGSASASSPRRRQARDPRARRPVPAMVCADADVDARSLRSSRHAYANTGQFCYRVNRL